MPLPPRFLDEAIHGLKVETSESFRLDHISPGSGRPGRSWDFSSGEMDSELVFQPGVTFLWQEGPECPHGSQIPPPLSVTCPLGTRAGLVLGWWLLAESSACLQTSLGAFAQTP